MTDFQLFIYVFFIVFIVSVFVYFRVKFLLKKLYPKKHDEVFANKLTSQSIDDSLKFSKFSFRQKEWGDISDPIMIRWLKINRVMFFLDYGIGAYAILNILYALARELFI